MFLSLSINVYICSLYVSAIPITVVDHSRRAFSPLPAAELVQLWNIVLKHWHEGHWQKTHFLYSTKETQTVNREGLVSWRWRAAGYMNNESLTQFKWVKYIQVVWHDLCLVLFTFSVFPLCLSFTLCFLTWPRPHAFLSTAVTHSSLCRSSAALIVYSCSHFSNQVLSFLFSSLPLLLGCLLFWPCTRRLLLRLSTLKVPLSIPDVSIVLYSLSSCFTVFCVRSLCISSPFRLVFLLFCVV